MAKSTTRKKPASKSKGPTQGQRLAALEAQTAALRGVVEAIRPGLESQGQEAVDRFLKTFPE